jgi:hypothetical protein
MLVCQILVRCKRPGCNNLIDRGVVAVESEKQLMTWLENFAIQKVTCPCGLEAEYQREDVLANPLGK